jgi:hypothetical protein
MGRATGLGELSMLPALVNMLRQSGRVRPDTLVVAELAWHGRRVDLVTMTRRGVMSAYELKLAGFGRALEQAIYNRLSFDRSWMVVDSVPCFGNLQQAERQGVGVIVVQEAAQVIVGSPFLRNELAVRDRLAHKIRSVGSRDV